MIGTLSGLSALLTVIFYATIVRRVQSRHSSSWIALGCPGYLFDPTQSNAHHMLGFVHEGGWLHKRDFVLASYCIGYCFFEISTVATFVAAIVFD